MVCCPRHRPKVVPLVEPRRLPIDCRDVSPSAANRCEPDCQTATWSRPPGAMWQSRPDQRTPRPAGRARSLCGIPAGKPLQGNRQARGSTLLRLDHLGGSPWRLGGRVSPVGADSFNTTVTSCRRCLPQLAQQRNPVRQVDPLQLSRPGGEGRERGRSFLPAGEAETPCYRARWSLLRLPTGSRTPCRFPRPARRPRLRWTKGLDPCALS
jgi:hypothetical protein